MTPKPYNNELYMCNGDVTDDEETSMKEDEYEIDQTFIEIDKLQENGVNAADISKLKANGIATLKAVIMTSSRNMAKIKGLSESKIEKIKEAADRKSVV